MLHPSSSISPYSPSAESFVTAADWFSGGTRVHFSTSAKKMTASPQSDTVAVFERVAGSSRLMHDRSSRWLTLLPGFPDGSYGFSKVEQLFSNSKASLTPRLYVEYVGQGDSDTPSKYKYGTLERADLVQAQWEAHGIQRTVVTTFDYSSLVLLELLQRQREGKLSTRIEHVLIVNGGLFADGHSHPKTTTPLLKTPAGKIATWAAHNSNTVFDYMLKPLYGKEYRLAKLKQKELREVEKAIRLHNGTSFLSNSAGFVDEHKKNATRWDLERVYVDYAQAQGITVHVVGSAEDPFEYRQIGLAKDRLAPFYPSVSTERIPGGHMATAEQAAKLVLLMEVLISKTAGGSGGTAHAWTTL